MSGARAFAVELRAAHGLAIEAIDSIECRVPAGEVPIVCEPAASKARPRTTYEAQFSLPFSVAAAFVDGRVGVDTYTPSRLDDPRVLAMRRGASGRPWLCSQALATNRL